MSKESDIDDQLEDLDMQMNSSVNIISLKDMYNSTFQSKEPLKDFSWDPSALVNSLTGVFKRVSRLLVGNLEKKLGRKTSDAEKKAVWMPIRDYLAQLKRDNTGGKSVVVEKLESLIENDYSRSALGSDEYKKATKDYQKYAIQLLVSQFGEVPEMDVTVDMAKKSRLLRIIQMAIKIGLNYQMLSEFDVKFLPEQYEFDDDDYETYFAGVLVPPGKKVKVSDLATSPYWEGIRVVPDMGDYVSVQSLGSDQLVNMVKRTTLYKIYQVSKDYRLNLDDASPSALKTLCSLKTLELAPDVHEGACRYFEGGMDWMGDLYTAWLNSNKSFKPYRKSVEDTSTFITVPDIPYSAETTVNEVMDDLSLLPGLIQYRKHDDHENEIRKNGDLFLVNDPSDAEFAMELSQQFVELGFLPEGYERYCGVKVGEVRAKRSASGTVSPSKRPRERLFTAVETY